jgi:hypothetical protein
MYLKNQAEVVRLVRRLVAMLEGGRQPSRPLGAAASPTPR